MNTPRWVALVRTRYAAHVLVASLLVTVLVVVTQLPRLRSAEAELAALVLAFMSFPDAQARTDNAIVVFTLTDGDVVGVHISAQSSAALLLLPMLLAAVAAIWLRPAYASSAMKALASAAATLVITNQTRVLLVGLVADSTSPRYRPAIGATVLGTMVTVLCTAIAMLVFIFVFVRSRRTNGQVSTKGIS